jgi:hypothetical protein
MIENLVAHGRKLVTIVDPHIKKDSGRQRTRWPTARSWSPLWTRTSRKTQVGRAGTVYGRFLYGTGTVLENLVAHGRKLVTIVDPHIKKDSGRQSWYLIRYGTGTGTREPDGPRPEAGHTFKKDSGRQSWYLIWQIFIWYGYRY